MKYFLSFLIAAALTGLTLVVPATAKIKKYGDGTDLKSVSSKAAIAEFWRFSNCAAKRNLTDALALLQNPEWDETISIQVAKFTEKHRGCLPRESEMRFRSKLFRGSLAAAYLSQKYEKQTAPDYGSVSTSYTPAALDALAGEAERASFMLRAFADCVVRNQPALALSLFVSKPAGKNEKVILGYLRPTMGGCLPMEDGAQIKFTATSLRGLMAEAAFDLELRYAGDKVEEIVGKTEADS